MKLFYISILILLFTSPFYSQDKLGSPKKFFNNDSLTTKLFDLDSNSINYRDLLFKLFKKDRMQLFNESNMPRVQPDPRIQYNMPEFIPDPSIKYNMPSYHEKSKMPIPPHLFNKRKNPPFK